VGIRRQRFWCPSVHRRVAGSNLFRPDVTIEGRACYEAIGDSYTAPIELPFVITGIGNQCNLIHFRLPLNF